jgi:hypothetical protein
MRVPARGSGIGASLVAALLSRLATPCDPGATFVDRAISRVFAATSVRAGEVAVLPADVDDGMATTHGRR